MRNLAHILLISYMKVLANGGQRHFPDKGVR